MLGVRGPPAWGRGLDYWEVVMNWSLDHHGIEDVRLALRVARETVDGYALDLENIGDALRAGQSVPPFVDGEGGAVAAERLALSHRATARRLQFLEENLEQSELDALEVAERRGVRS